MKHVLLAFFVILATPAFAQSLETTENGEGWSFEITDRIRSSNVREVYATGVQGSEAWGAVARGSFPDGIALFERSTSHISEADAAAKAFVRCESVSHGECVLHTTIVNECMVAVVDENSGFTATSVQDTIERAEAGSWDVCVDEYPDSQCAIHVRMCPHLWD